MLQDRNEGFGELPPDSPDRSTRQTILIVDDEDVVLQSTATILSRAGYDVLVACDREAALQASREHRQPIDLLLTDVLMPGVSGPDLVTQVRELHPNIRYIYMSGFPQAELIDRGLKLDAVVLQKPFMPSTLRRRVGEALDVPQA